MIERSQELAKALEASGGKAVVLVHPLFKNTYSSGAEQEARTNALIELQKQIASKGGWPVIILEEHHRVEEVRQHFPNAFFVKTLRSNPKPVRGWKPLFDVLEKNGLKQVSVGGQCLTTTRTQAYGPNEVDKEAARWQQTLGMSQQLKTYPHIGCVLGAIEAFARRGFKTRLMTRATLPDQVKLMKIAGRTKE